MTTHPRDLKYFFPKFPTLSNQRLTLREITPDDIADIVSISFYDGIPATSEAEALVMLDKIHSDYQRGESIHWGICLAEKAEVIGTCTFYGGYPHNVAEIGYVLKEPYRGQGIMTEAVKLVLEFGFRSMRLSSIMAQTNTENLKSIGILQKLGFQEASGENDNLKFIKHPFA